MKSEFECLSKRGGQKVLLNWVGPAFNAFNALQHCRSLPWKVSLSAWRRRRGQEVLFHKVLLYWVGHAFNTCMLCSNCKIPAMKSEFECLGEKKRSSTFLVLLPPVSLKCPSLCVLTYIPLPFYCEFCLKQNTALLSHVSQLVREVVKKTVILRSGWP